MLVGGLASASPVQQSNRPSSFLRHLRCRLHGSGRSRLPALDAVRSPRVVAWSLSVTLTALVVLTGAATSSDGATRAQSNARAVAGDVAAPTRSHSSRPPGRRASYPASYFNGPLGRRNPVPPTRGAFLLAWHSRSGWTRTKAGILERHRAIGRPFDGIATVHAPSERREAWIHKQGALPIIAGWTPGGTPEEIAAGARDKAIAAFAKRIGRYPFVVMVRMFHEFDQEHLAYHSCGERFAAMWRRVVTVVKQRGAGNVGFWWSPGEGYGRECTRSSYPGDAYVDWVGSDAYNHCFVGEAHCYSTPYRPGWAEFEELFDYEAGHANLTTQHDLFGPRKPFVVGETGTVYDPSSPGRKGDWYRSVVPAAKKMRYLRGVMFFDVDATATEVARNNWHVDFPRAESGVYQGFVDMASNAWFKTRVPAASPRGG